MHLRQNRTDSVSPHVTYVTSCNPVSPLFLSPKLSADNLDAKHWMKDNPIHCELFTQVKRPARLFLGCFRATLRCRVNMDSALRRTALRFQLAFNFERICSCEVPNTTECEPCRLGGGAVVRSAGKRRLVVRCHGCNNLNMRGHQLDVWLTLIYGHPTKYKVEIKTYILNNKY